MTQLIRMVREHGEPKAADVHPDEVENYRHGGFEVVGNPLDHDGNGVAGGSLAGDRSTAAKGARNKRKAKG